MDGEPQNKRSRCEESLAERVAFLEKQVAEMMDDKQIRECSEKAEEKLMAAFQNPKFKFLRQELSDGDVKLSIKVTTGTTDVRAICFVFSYYDARLTMKFFAGRCFPAFHGTTFYEKDDGQTTNISDTIDFYFMSVENQDKWEQFAKHASLPQSLQKVERATEFLLAVILEASCQRSIRALDFVASMYWRDGEFFYKGHGGTMKAGFAPPSEGGELSLMMMI